MVPKQRGNLRERETCPGRLTDFARDYYIFSFEVLKISCLSEP